MRQAITLSVFQLYDCRKCGLFQKLITKIAVLTHLIKQYFIR